MQVRETPIELLITMTLIPISFYILISPKINFPKYLLLFILFTLYRSISIWVNDLVPPEMNLVRFMLSDKNVVACLLFFVIENTDFDQRFIKLMTRNIFIVVIISLLVSLVQFKYPTFFVAPEILENANNENFLRENRIFSIYSWQNLNSLGTTFPIMIGILLNFYSQRRTVFPFIFFAGIVVSFLSKARYVMLSTIIVISQLFFTSSIKSNKKIYILLIFFASFMVAISVAKLSNYDIQQVIDERILEKGTNMGSANTRVLSFYVFLKVFPDHPLLGVGPATQFEVVRLLGGSAPLIHIGYLSYLYFYGVVGCFFLFFSIFFMLRYAWIIGSKYEFWAGFYGLLAFCVANLTMVYFNFSEMGIILTFIYLKYFKDTASEELSTV